MVKISKTMSSGLQVKMQELVKKNLKMKSRNKDKLESFVKYCKERPQERFFQALRNWIQGTVDTKWNWLYVGDGNITEDTFYWE